MERRQLINVHCLGVQRYPQESTINTQNTLNAQRIFTTIISTSKVLYNSRTSLGSATKVSRISSPIQDKISHQSVSLRSVLGAIPISDSTTASFVTRSVSLTMAESVLPFTRSFRPSSHCLWPQYYASLFLPPLVRSRRCGGPCYSNH